jgi:hypothetical protein
MTRNRLRRMQVLLSPPLRCSKAKKEASGAKVVVTAGKKSSESGTNPSPCRKV